MLLSVHHHLSTVRSSSVVLTDISINISSTQQIADCLQTQETKNQPLQSGLILENQTLNPAEIFNMASKKVLVVFGATGMQGGSVVRAILSDPKTREAFTVRGVTRDVSKDSAKALESLGAETVAVSGIGCN